MITSAQALATAAQKVPAYCATGHLSRTPAQIQTCLKLGWQMSTGGAANLGTAAGKGTGATLLVVLAIVLVLLVGKALIAGGTGKTATN